MKKYLLFSFLLALAAMAFMRNEKYTLTGKVTDSMGNPVAGASIQVKMSNIATVADNDGNFRLLVAGNETLVFSAVNFKTKEKKIARKKTLNVTLTRDNMVLNEVVVTGIGTIKGDMAETYYSFPSASYSVNSNAVAFETRGFYNSGSVDKRKDGGFDYDRGREGYDLIVENPFLKAKDNPLSSFSIDVDAASYSNVRRFINEGQLPPAGAVRIEEMINYFNYDYKQPETDAPFNVNIEASECPWNNKHQLVLIGIQGKKIPNENLPPSNLVFLIDVSGSMDEPNKLPLVQSSMKLLANQLRPQDKVSIVVYAGNAGLVLPATPGNKTAAIKAAIEQLQAGGSTAGGEGIQLAYKIAKQSFIKDGNNRVILCTDGDFNVGMSSDDELVRLIENERKSGVYLTVLGFGMGNYQDSKMQQLADKGNGNHAYIDNINEAKKVLVKEAGGTLYTIAKDVKLQIEFNPTKVQGYRLIGYENRMLAKEDFNDDRKDAGELGSGHTVTALYEIIPVGVKSTELKEVDSLRYKVSEEPFSENSFSDELMYVKMRFKKPDVETSQLIEFPLEDRIASLNKTSDNFRFAAAVAQFGMILRDSKHKGTASFESVYELASKALSRDKEGYRKEFLELVEKASEIK